MAIQVALILFDGVELLDFAGPLEVLSVARAQPYAGPPAAPSAALFGVRLLAASPTVTTANGHGYTLARDVDLHAAAGAPALFDAVLVPGGRGARAALADERLLAWLRRFVAAAAADGRRRTVLTVCTGSLIVAAAGLVDAGMCVATHHAARDDLARLLAGKGCVVEERVAVQDAPWGRLVTCGGVSSGFDMAFRWVEEVVGREVAEITARFIEYEGQGWKER